MAFFPVLLELPAPPQDVIGLLDPGKQPGVFKKAGIAIHAMGVGIPVGETAVQAQPVILPLADQDGFFFRLVHNLQPVIPRSLSLSGSKNAASHRRSKRLSLKR